MILMSGISFKIILKGEQGVVCIDETRLVMELENNFDIFLPQLKYIPTHY